MTDPSPHEDSWTPPAPPHGVSDASPVFVVGAQRSGTSALWRAIRSHPNLLIPDDVPPNREGRPILKELWFLREFFLGRETNAHRPHADSLIDVDFAHRFADLVDTMNREYFAGPSGRWVSAHPADGVYLREILRLYPKAKVVFLTRHPQEVLWSALHAKWVQFDDRKQFLEQATSTARWWRRFGTLAVEIEEGGFGDSAVLVRQEDMIRRPDEVARRCLDHIGETQHPDVAASLGTVFNSSFLANDEKATQVEKSRADVGTDPELCERVVAMVGDLMARLDYADLSGRHADTARAYAELQQPVERPIKTPEPRDSMLVELERYFTRHPRTKRWVYNLLGLGRRQARRAQREERGRQAASE